MLRRFLIGLIVMMIAVLVGPTSVASAVAPDAYEPTYTYDDPTYDAPENYTASERGPPVAGHVNTIDDADDLRSEGSSARPELSSNPDRPTTYDASVALAQITRATGTRQTRTQGDDGPSLAPAPLEVAAKGVAPAKRATGTTVLGHYPEYVKMSDDLMARRFDIPTDVWNRMSSTQQWTANRTFLDRTISRGDDIRLATPIDAVRPGSFYERELQYLMSRGYSPGSDGLSLLGPR